jgi:hypothetical protein
VEKVLNDSIVEEILSLRLKETKEFQKCSFILPNGKFLKMYEHYEAYRFLVAECLCPCIPDAEQLLSDLGYVRYSWVGYITLPDKALTEDQYKALELALIHIAKLKDKISVQIQSQPKFFINFPLDDIPNIIRKIKMFYTYGNLLP